MQVCLLVNQLALLKNFVEDKEYFQVWGYCPTEFLVFTLKLTVFIDNL